MIKFYYNTGPNPMKIALFLEEANLDYEAIPIDTRKGEQHKDDYLKINPNAKAPTIVDGDNIIFDSNAILLYLGEKTNKFMPNNDLKSKSELYSWLMFVATGIGPYSGQSVHFQHMAPEKIKYAKEEFLPWTQLNSNLMKMSNVIHVVSMVIWQKIVHKQSVMYVVKQGILQGIVRTTSEYIYIIEKCKIKLLCVCKIKKNIYVNYA